MFAERAKDSGFVDFSDCRERREETPQRPGARRLVEGAALGLNQEARAGRKSEKDWFYCTKQLQVH